MPTRTCTCWSRWSFGAGLPRDPEDDAMRPGACVLWPEITERCNSLLYVPKRISFGSVRTTPYEHTCNCGDLCLDIEADRESSGFVFSVIVCVQKTMFAYRFRPDLHLVISAFHTPPL